MRRIPSPQSFPLTLPALSAMFFPDTQLRNKFFDGGTTPVVMCLIRDSASIGVELTGTMC
jgi:hypothetical protein